MSAQNINTQNIDTQNIDIQKIYKKKYIKYKNKCKQINKKFKGGFIEFLPVFILIAVVIGGGGAAAKYYAYSEDRRGDNKDENNTNETVIKENFPTLAPNSLTLDSVNSTNNGVNTSSKITVSSDNVALDSARSSTSDPIQSSTSDLAPRSSGWGVPEFLNFLNFPDMFNSDKRPEGVSSDEEEEGVNLDEEEGDVSLDKAKEKIQTYIDKGSLFKQDDCSTDDFKNKILKIFNDKYDPKNIKNIGEYIEFLKIYEEYLNTLKNQQYSSTFFSIYSFQKSFENSCVSFLLELPPKSVKDKRSRMKEIKEVGNPTEMITESLTEKIDKIKIRKNLYEEIKRSINNSKDFEVSLAQIEYIEDMEKIEYFIKKINNLINKIKEINSLIDEISNFNESNIKGRQLLKQGLNELSDKAAEVSTISEEVQFGETYRILKKLERLNESKNVQDTVKNIAMEKATEAADKAKQAKKEAGEALVELNKLSKSYISNEFKEPIKKSISNIKQLEQLEEKGRLIQATDEYGTLATERLTLYDMRKSIKMGDSFTEYMSKHNHNDTQKTENGARLNGARIHGNDKHTEGWYKLGGRFTEGEATFINEVRENPKNASPHKEPIGEEKIQKKIEDMMNRLIGNQENALINYLNKSNSRFILSEEKINAYKTNPVDEEYDKELKKQNTVAQVAAHKAAIAEVATDVKVAAEKTEEDLIFAVKVATEAADKAKVAAEKAKVAAEKAEEAVTVEVATDVKEATKEAALAAIIAAATIAAEEAEEEDNAEEDNTEKEVVLKAAIAAKEAAEAAEEAAKAAKEAEEAEAATRVAAEEKAAIIEKLNVNYTEAVEAEKLAKEAAEEAAKEAEEAEDADKATEAKEKAEKAKVAAEKAEEAVTVEVAADIEAVTAATAAEEKAKATAKAAAKAAEEAVIAVREVVLKAAIAAEEAAEKAEEAVTAAEEAEAAEAATRVAAEEKAKATAQTEADIEAVTAATEAEEKAKAAEAAEAAAKAAAEAEEKAKAAEAAAKAAAEAAAKAAAEAAAEAAKAAEEAVTAVREALKVVQAAEAAQTTAPKAEEAPAEEA